MESEVKLFTIYTEPGKNPISNRSCLAPWAVARTESAFGDSYSMYLLHTLLVATVPDPITFVVKTLPQNLSMPSLTVPTVKDAALFPPGILKWICHNRFVVHRMFVQ